MHLGTGKRYIGKSVNVEARISQHRYSLTRPARNKKHTNRHLHAAVQKYGWDAFSVEILESFSAVDEAHIAARELFWMDHFQTCDRSKGFNLRRDSATRMIVHDETRALNSAATNGFANPNYGNFWSEDQRNRMSEIAKARHASGEFYGDEWKAKQSIASTETWKDLEKRQAMGRKVAVKKRKYDYLQFTREGEFIRRWSSVEEIISANPTWKWQNIYNVCHGHKPTYQGFVWRQEPKSDFEELL